MDKIIRSVKGTRDFYPDEMAVRRWLITRIQEVSTAFGYQEYEGPCLETIDLYAAKSGEELVKDQAFVFPDRSGENIALRPELTPTLARMIASKQNELIFPCRWWSFGPFWRYERPQKGRTREFYQWNIDLIGSDEVAADAELIAVAAEFFRSVGVRPDQVKILINDRRLMDAQLSRIGIPADLKPAVLRMIDRIDKQPPDVWDANTRALGVNPQQLVALRSLLDDCELWQQSDDLKALFAGLDALGVREYTAYEPKIIRGLDYYTGTVFEARDTAGNFRAILGGGHYANLVAEVGGSPLPGVGFAMGDVVVLLLLESLGLIPEMRAASETVFISVFDESCQAASSQSAARLRAAGFRVVAYPGAEKLAKQLKYADRLGARAALVIGPDEIARSEVVVKDLLARSQRVVPAAELEKQIAAMLAER
ncbi:MAG TPA: histidine--tRNA ligase [Anaerolineaceae bacterium]|jgi:histidyl-tRNA synthetase|nr:histidine--tRNA ligase [Anaerolineaceae bacterium]HOR83773.1 histidine--tRNA ligase [Anaerolineaceae bacterium]HPL42703.1 histidine--tRNA ligase [Anaerolineaceae bacterium]